MCQHTSSELVKVTVAGQGQTQELYFWLKNRSEDRASDFFEPFVFKVNSRYFLRYASLKHEILHSQGVLHGYSVLCYPLSHTWEQEEVTFQDIQNLKTAQSKAGWHKVKNACLRARRYHFDWIWIDSCCINKESSTELSEALNSMYQCYEDAAICYVYLSDVSGEYHPGTEKSNFRDSRWFRRGWTLQELLAPEYVMFLDKDWERIGTRWGLREVVSVATGIPVDVFEGRIIDEYSVAQRMSWAAFRETTRPEDQAYCLLGIFGVSMSPIYGEGGVKAFMRLQQEIIRISDDRSIFAWVAARPMKKELKGLEKQWENYYTPQAKKDETRGLLARSPYEFRMSGDVQTSNVELIGNKSSYSFNNNSLHIHLPLNPIPFSSEHFGEPIFLAHLLCQSTRGGSHLTIYLRKTSGHQYVRCYADEVFLTSSPLPMDDIRELTVTERLVTGRRVRASNTSSLTSRYKIELLQSAWDFFPQGPAFGKSNISSTHTVFLSLGPFKEDVVRYQSQKTGDSFLIACINDRPSLSIGDKWIGGPGDTHLGKLKSGNYIIITSERRGYSQEKIDVGYLAKDDPEIRLWTGPLQLPDLGVIVHSMLSIDSSDYHLKFQGIFPPDPFGRITQDMVYATIFRPRPDDPKECSCPMFRLFTYRCDPFDPRIIHVAFGLQGSSVWTDIVVQDTSSHETSESVWKSYLDFGPRAGKRLKGEEFAEAKFTGYSLFAVIKSTKNLQLGDYSLRMHWGAKTD
ncbi:hypothetical protein D9758_005961 [Tetrapyrgos nigripes]|uniref:HET-domain-containing protein n=1 Tax=Tetrapyrgos nigripes TaxID=182062 RepID=A0A8H5G2W6_9AGAR|nr:hypothetical protein D9758_005961 [Tetrapyrgos nigripes]